MLPDFNENGDLPIGIYRATLPEVIDRFGTGTGQRRRVAQRLERIHELAHTTGAVERFIVFGSFITDKLEPDDVDVVIIMMDSFDPDQLSGESKLLFDHRSSSAFRCERLLAEATRNLWGPPRHSSLIGRLSAIANDAASWKSSRRQHDSERHRTANDLGTDSSLSATIGSSTQSRNQSDQLSTFVVRIPCRDRPHATRSARILGVAASRLKERGLTGRAAMPRINQS